MASTRPKLPQAVQGDTLMVLCIDGGGVRGIIPAKVITFLEDQLNKEDPRAKDDARIAEYFDVISGTSTGGVLTSLFASLKQDGSLRSAQEILQLYIEKAPTIFPQNSDTVMAIKQVASMQQELRKEGESIWEWIKKKICKLAAAEEGEEKSILDWIKQTCRLLSVLEGPKYDGKALRELAEEQFGEIRMNQTATDILLTGFDVYTRHPVTFSTYEGKKDANQNVLVKDATISTGSAPVYLPPYYFENGNTDFNAVDGGIAANNPSMVALAGLIYRNYASKNITIEDLIKGKKAGEHPDPFPAQLLSLGCGQGQRHPYSAKDKWAGYDWLYNFDAQECPIVEFLLEASPDITNVQAQLVFQFLNRPSYPNGYLRVQEYNLPLKNTPIDDSSMENLNELEEIGGKLIGKNAKIVNPITGETEDVQDASGTVITNEEAVKQFAKTLVKERNKRLDRDMFAKKP